MTKPGISSVHLCVCVFARLASNPLHMWYHTFKVSFQDCSYSGWGLIVSTLPHAQRHAGMQCVLVFAQWLGRNNQTSSQWLWTQWELGIAQLSQWQPTPHRLSACSTQVPDLRCTPVVGSCVSLWQTKFKAATDLIQALTPFLFGDDDFGEKLVKVVGRGGVSTWPWPVHLSW